MQLLLDTHVFLWFISGDARLSAQTRAILQNEDNSVFLSVVSVWEAIVKYQPGKLPLPHPPGSYIAAQRERHEISSLALDEASVALLHTLPTIHKDPFDRMMICQALRHSLTLVTLDAVLKAYPATTLDA